MKKALAIGGSDSCGGAGIQADLKTFAALGVYGTSVITSVTAQNSLGVQGNMCIDPLFVSLQIESIFSDIYLDAIKIGVTPNNEIINSIASKLKEYPLNNIVLDPVMYSHNYSSLLNPGSKNILVKKLFPLALLITPNIPEAKILTGINIKNYNDIKMAAKRIIKLGAKNVLIKGGHHTGKAIDTFYDGGNFNYFEAKRIPGKNVHGTGCTLASAIAAELAKGTSLIEAIQKAKNFLTNSIAHSIQIGHGSNTINHFFDCFHDNDKYQAYWKMESALDILEKGEIGCLIPEIQSNLGYAMIRAKSKEDIIAFPDRIVKKGNGIAAVSRPEFGGSSHIAAVILTAMERDPGKRAAMNIKYLPEIITACKKLKLSVSSFSRAKEPKSIKEKEGSSLEWGTKRVIEKFGAVPDIIYDTGGMGKEPIIRIIASDPVSAANTVIKIKNEYIKTGNRLSAQRKRTSKT